MLYNMRRRLKTWNFDRQIGAIMDTPPLRVVDSSWSIVSMVKNRDVPMYLLSIKAFYAHMGAGRIIAIIDRDMPGTLRDTLRRHVEGIELVVLEDLDTGTCQRGGTWERLVFLLDRSAEQYVIQLDSDVLAVGPDLAELKDCIDRNVAFTIADGGKFRSMRRSAAIAQADPDTRYVGIAIEQLFDKYPDCDRLRYIRGSSGLAAFARGGFTRSQIEEFHRVMEGLLPDRWHEWGSEQCGSNFAVANSPGAVALPYPEYGTFTSRIEDRERCKCFHFIGSIRFVEGYFAKRGREIIRSLYTEHAAAA
jgi:hypothetical protein